MNLTYKHNTDGTITVFCRSRQVGSLHHIECMIGPSFWCIKFVDSGDGYGKSITEQDMALLTQKLVTLNADEQHKYKEQQ